MTPEHNVRNLPPPAKRLKVPADDPESRHNLLSVSSIGPPSLEIPHVLQGEIARLDQKFKVSLDQSSQIGTKIIKLVCYLDDKHLPCVPPVSIVIPGKWKWFLAIFRNSQNLLSFRWLSVVGAQLQAHRAGVQCDTVFNLSSGSVDGTHLQTAEATFTVAPVGHVGDVCPSSMRSEAHQSDQHFCSDGHLMKRTFVNHSCCCCCYSS